jgi:hypothetical protein
MKTKSKLSDKYYVYNEWTKLSNEEQQQVRALRNERDKKRGVQAVTFAPDPTVHHYNPVNTVADLPPPVPAPASWCRCSLVSAYPYSQ